MKDRMKRNTKVTLALCLAALGTAIEARADCQNVSGSIKETIIPAPNDPYGRALGTVHGVLNGVDTAVITSPDGSKSFDVIVTNRGDMLTGNGCNIDSRSKQLKRVHGERDPDDQRRIGQVQWS
jgi:hypothetical protein